MKMSHRLAADKLVSLIKGKIPSQELQVEEESENCRIHFPLGEKSSYDFNLYLYKEEESYIEAEIGAVPRDLSEEKEVFWNMPFERYDYDTQKDLDQKARETLVKLLTRPTRIIQRRTLLLWNFLCETQEGGNWGKVYGMGFFRPTFNGKVPKITGTEKVYFGFPFGKGPSQTS